MEVVRALDPAHTVHLEQARRVLSLPIEESGMHWHPFGVYTVPMSRKDGWSRRLHIWHPSATPVGEASPYGVHTHSGPARSHVLAGTLHHHLYAFGADAEGIWQEMPTDRRASLLAHVWEPTVAGQTHSLPADHPHGVTKPPGFAISLFEQEIVPAERPFTTWQRQDVPAEEVLQRPPVPVSQVHREAWQVLEQALFDAE